MSARRSSLTLRKSTPRGPTSSPISLVARDIESLAHDDVDDDALLSFEGSVIIAGIVPVPTCIPSGVRDALERMMLLRFSGNSDKLDCWLHEDHSALNNASPFEALIAGDGLGVLRALVDSSARVSNGRVANARRQFDAQLRLMR